jgi:general nucleoside transport system ATP-binding protein
MKLEKEDQRSMPGSEILRAENISKSFGPVKANADINISLFKGEIISILGENGAGKSTLMNVLYGLYHPTSGSIYINNEKVRFQSPRDAISKGIGMVHQHFMLIEPLTVTENIVLGNEPNNWRGINYAIAREQVLTLSNKFNLKIDPDAVVGDLPVGLQQRVEILKALYRKVQILILDEPTAVLTPQEVQDFFKVVTGLKENGVSVIIITHKLEEVKQISSRVYILRKGRIAGESPTEGVSKIELANLMVGRDVVLQVDKQLGKVEKRELFSIDKLSVTDGRGILALDNLSLDVHPGEIVAIAGVDGNGQEELAEAVMGLRKIDSGEISLEGNKINHWSTKKRIESGISYVPADRQKSGLVLPFTIGENTLLGNHRKPPLVSKGLLNENEIYDYADKLVNQYGVLTSSSRETANHLSGGN